MIAIKLAILALLAALLPRSLAETRAVSNPFHDYVGDRTFLPHLYILPEMCSSFVRELKFSEQVILESQRSAERYYRTNSLCRMKFKPQSAEIGLVVAFKIVDTENCEDYLLVTPEFSPELRLCGHLFTNDAPQRSRIYNKETIEVEWNVAPHAESMLLGRGFQMVITAFQNSCPKNATCFLCKNGLYVHLHNVCNGQNNCGDMSDEEDCPTYPNSIAHPLADYTPESPTEFNKISHGHHVLYRPIQSTIPPWLPTYILPPLCDKSLRTVKFSEQVTLRSDPPGGNEYRTGVDCNMTFGTESWEIGLVVAFKIVDTENCDAFVDVRPQVDEHIMLCGPLFTDNKPQHSLYLGNQTVDVQWKAKSNEKYYLHRKGFLLVITAFRHDCPANDACFHCKNGLYIHRSNKCNGHNNCGDMSDEADCHPTPSLDDPYTFLLTLAACLGVLFIFTVVAGGVIGWKLVVQRNALLRARDETDRHSFLANQQVPCI